MLATPDIQNSRTGRTRRCAVTGKSMHSGQLIRFVVSPDGEVMPDLAMRLPGRGMWIGASKSLVETAIRRRTFCRALKTSVPVPDGLSDQIVRLLKRRCLSLLGLARRSGMIVTGSRKCRRHLERAGEPACLVIAFDACPRTSGLLRRAWSGRFSTSPVVITAFDKAELGKALGRHMAAYALLPHNALAEKLIIDASRLAGFESAPSHPAIRA